jgi:mannose-6-phosphate isomerase-like protein (cupin superfamily)
MKPDHSTMRPVPDERELAEGLAAEGFTHTYTWQDAANECYPDHSHPQDTAHVILAGEMTLTCEGRRRTYRAGERVDVPAGVTHSAAMGPAGCRYLVGERERAAPAEGTAPAGWR